MTKKPTYEELEQRAKELEKEATMRKMAEEAMRETRDYLENLINYANAPIIVWNSEFRITRFNHAFERLTGYAADEVISQKVDMLFPEARRDESLGGMGATFSNEYRESVEIPILCKDGSVRMALWNSANIPAEDGKTVVATIAQGTAITDQKQAEEERKKLDAQPVHTQKMESIGTVAGCLAHDFNNLLMAAQGNVSLMLSDVDSTHPHYEGLKNIETQIRSSARLTRQLVEYSRKGKYEVKPINLNELVEETPEAFGRTRKEIAIHRELAEDLRAIEADQGQIEQVLLNLYINAADAMPDGGDLILKTMNVTHRDMRGKLYNPNSGNYISLTVTDTGQGMDQVTVQRIFDPFFTTKEMGRGTGLGLASVYGIIKGHGGYIDVESEKGRGTTFSIYLPATDKKVKRVPEADREVICGSGTILLVDDEQVVLDIGSKWLKRLGYTVLEAKGGREAVETYEANRDNIDLVILDIIMPDMGGGKAYDRMKESNADVKVLLSSGCGIEGEAKEILERGCNGFIQKPFRMNELAEKIREILDKK